LPPELAARALTLAQMRIGTPRADARLAGHIKSTAWRARHTRSNSAFAARISADDPPVPVTYLGTMPGDLDHAMTLGGIIVRIAALLMAVAAATWISSEIRAALDMTMKPENEDMMKRMILVATLAFVILLAIPFVPGAEIGLTLLTLFGATIAPLIYGATITALVLAFSVGRFLPAETVVRGLRILWLNRAAQSVEDSMNLPLQDRMTRLMDGSSPRVLRLGVRYRYLALLAAINLPGNFLIGGGGGIALMAGTSRLFAPLPFLLTIAVAVAPVPLLVLLFGQ
jgi:hypothetical protein